MPKLPKGMVRKHRTYYYRRQVSGKEVYLSLGNDYDKARTKLKELKGKPLDSQVAVLAAAKEWVSSYCATQRGLKGQKLAAQRVRDYLVEFMGSKPLGRVGQDDLRAYRLWLTGKVSQQTVAHILSDARCFFRWAVENGYLNRSPVPKRLLPRLQERPPDRLSDEDCAKLSSAPEPYGRMVRFLLGTGLRWGEAVRATAGDVEDGVLVVHQTKSGKVRRVPLPAEFRSYVGRFVTLKNPSGLAKTVGRMTGVKFHVHQLRHSFACRWLEAGGSLVALQQLFGAFHDRHDTAIRSAF